MVFPARIPRLDLDSRRIVLQLFGVVATIAIGLIGLATMVGYWAASGIDNRSVERETAFVEQALANAIADVPEQQESITIWDDTVVNLRTLDQAWLDENIGVWMSTFFGHDRVYALDADNHPVYAMLNEANAPAEHYNRVSEIIAPLVARVRSDIAALEEPTPAEIGALGATDVLTLGDRLAIVSVKPIVPSSSAVSQAPGTEYLHISAKMISARLLRGIAEEYAIDNLQLLSPEQAEPSTVPIRNQAGAAVAGLHWVPYTPGRTMIDRLAWPFILAVVIAALYAALLLRRVWHATKLVEESQDRTRFLAFHDPLTGLPNRTLFERNLDGALADLARRGGTSVALHLVDIDRFKHVNDTLGHPVGDELVRQIGGRLAAVVSPGDTVARIGGDEFAIVQATANDPAQVEGMAERIRSVFRSTFNLDGEHAISTASIGIAIADTPAITRAELLRRADIALYNAKSQGGARHTLFTEDMDATSRQRRSIERDLRAALATDRELRVDYQPVFANDGVTVIGAEALVRWDHPIHGELPPDVFIHIAEERGLIDTLGDWVVGQACDMLRATNLPRVAVNISPLQLRREGFSQHLLTQIRRRGVDASRIEIEVTEGVLIEEGPTAEWAIATLREQGVSVALDDFGTGYSSIGYLHRYEVDKIKIDKSFVRRLGSSSAADGIVHAIISLARSMGRQVTAEGIETEAQLAFLTALGCEGLQGFLLSKPLTASQFKAFLAGRDSSLPRLTA